MVLLFVLGAFIGSGAMMIVDLSAENKKLSEKVKNYEKQQQDEEIEILSNE